MQRHIVAIGGASFEPDTPDHTIYRYLASLTGKAAPRACFLPTASGEDPEYIEGFKHAFSKAGCEATWLSLFQPHTAHLRDFLLEQDLIYVGGGNTKSMLALWREWGVDIVMRDAWEEGIVLAGLSAGAICWFEQGITDSIPGPLTALPCLELLKGSCCPHYDSEPERRPSYTRMVDGDEIFPGYAADDHVALHFIGDTLYAARSSFSGARAFHVRPGCEEEIEVIQL